MKRNLYFALLLSIVIPGLGYVYLAKKVWFGVLILIASAGDIAWRAVHDGFRMDIFLAITLVSFYAAILVDTYMTAKEVIYEQDTARPETR